MKTGMAWNSKGGNMTKKQMQQWKEDSIKQAYAEAYVELMAVVLMAGYATATDGGLI
jgi:hypothetical protein